MASPFDVLGRDSIQDTSKLNQLAYPVEGEEDPLKKINEGIETSIKDLENRYAQPNWWKVAAGFAKPQLGGFVASLGSAAEALGEQQEQQKALQIPLFKMRTELATNAAILNRNKTVNDKIAAYKREHNELPPPQLLAQWQAEAGESTGTKAMSNMAEASQKQQTLASQQNQIAISKITEERQLADVMHNRGMISDDDYNAKYKELDKRASALNSPSDIGATTNYTPTPQKVQTQGAPLPTGIPLGKPSAVPTSPIPGNPNLAPPNASKIKAQEPTLPEEYHHVVQALRPKGEPDAYYKALSENRAKDAQTQEERTNSILQSYYPAVDPIVVNNYQQAIKDLNEMQKNKDEKAAFVAIHDLLRKNGALAAAAQEGLAVHFGNFNANLALPVKAYEAAKVPEQYRSTIDRILSNYSILANTHMLMDGVKSINPNLDADKNILSRYAHIGQTASSALHAANDNYIDFSMRKRIMEEFPKIKSKIQNEHPDELAPTTSAYQSKQVKDIQDLYSQARKLELQKLRAGQNHSRQSSKQD